MKLRRAEREKQQRPATAEVVSSVAEQSERLFDPRVEMTEEDFQFYKCTLDRFLQEDKIISYAALARQVADLFPNRISELGMNSTMFNRVMYELHKTRRSSLYLVNYYQILVYFFPERRSELGFDDELFRDAKSAIDTMTDNE